MPLPKADSTALKLPASLQANIDAEAGQERVRSLRLNRPPREETVSLALSPINLSAMDIFERFYQDLRYQDRSIKRYQVMNAILAALEDDDMKRAVIARLDQ